MIAIRTVLALFSTAGLVAVLGCDNLKTDPNKPGGESAGTNEWADTTNSPASPKPLTARDGDHQAVTSAQADPKTSKATIPASADLSKAGPLFARTQLRPIEKGSSPTMTGNVELYGTQTSATMKIWVSNLTPGTYGVYLGKDCTAAAALHDTNAADGKGVGSATVREGEMRLGELVVAAAGTAELMATVPNNVVDAPLLTDQAIILMPASADKVEHLQTKTACGEIDLVPVGS